MYPPPYNPPIPVVTPPEPFPPKLTRDEMTVALADLHTRCPCGFRLPHANACTFSLDPEET